MKGEKKKTAHVRSIFFRLYVAGNAPNSQKAIVNMKAICQAHFEGANLEIIDLLNNPARALADGIIVTPTLLRTAPLPLRRVIGNLSEIDHVLMALGGN